MFSDTPLRVDYIGDGRFQLVEPIEYLTRDHKLITVKAGYTTDGASIPRFYRWRFGRTDGKWFRPAVIHDILYDTEYFPREYSDKVFLEAMEENGVSWWTRNVMYRAVSMFGGFTWNKHTKESKKEAMKYLEVRHRE